MLTAPSTAPVRWSTRAGTPNPTAATSGAFSSRTVSTTAASSASCESSGVGRSSVRSTLPSPATQAREDLRPAEVDPDDARAGQGGGYPTSPDGAGREALPRLSRRSRQGQGPGRAPAPTKPRRARAATAKPPAGRGTNGGGPGWKRRLKLPPLRRPPWKRVIALGILVLFALVVVWAVTGYLAFRSGVYAANKRLEPGRAPRSRSRTGCCSRTRRRSCCSAPTPRRCAGAPGSGTPTRSCSCAPTRRTTGSSYLSIPRDLLRAGPGLGSAKINAAYQAGGAALAIRTIRDFTGLKINHVVIVDFAKLQGPDRRRGRDHGQRAGADPLEPLRLPVRTRRAASSGRAGASPRAGST